MANRNFASAGKIYSMHVMPVLLDCNFVVDSTNGNGLGIRSLKGPMIKNVYMHTSASPAAGNPNPSAGSIVIQLEDNFNRSLSGFSAIVSPVSGSPLTSTTVNIPVIIVSLGSATPAQSLSDFRAKGLPLGITPAVGVAFVPTASGVIGHSAAVEIAAALGSGVATIETLGDPNATLAPDPSQNQGFGGQIILQCRDYAGAIVAPADGSVISIAMYLNNSAVLVKGE